MTSVKAAGAAACSTGVVSEHPCIPRFPRAGAAALGFASLLPLNFALGRLAASLARRHPALFERLGDQTAKSFMIDPTDMPFVFLLAPRPEAPLLVAARREAASAWDARIAGSLAALLGLVHGAYDGDALFFSRDLVIEGDTAAVLALRNAVDNEELDLVAEGFAPVGPLAALATAPASRLAALVAGLTGVALTRRSGGSFA